MKLLGAAVEPDATPTPEGSGLLELGETEQVSVEPTGFALAPGRCGDLYVVQPQYRRRGFAVIRSQHRVADAVEVAVADQLVLPQPPLFAKAEPLGYCPASTVLGGPDDLY